MYIYKDNKYRIGKEMQTLYGDTLASQNACNCKYSRQRWKKLHTARVDIFFRIEDNFRGKC